MKQLLTVLLLTSFCINCSPPQGGHPSNIKIEAMNGEGEVKSVNFQIAPKLYDSLGMTREEVESIAKIAVTYADWNVKNELTYDFDDGDYSNWILPFDTVVMVSVKGKAKNSFGVPQSIINYIHFDTDGELILNEDGLCQPGEYYLTDDTNSVMTPVVFGEVVEGYEDPFVDTVSTYNDSIRFDSLMRVN